MPVFPSEIHGFYPLHFCGRGAYGEVWLVQDEVGRRLALKVVHKALFFGAWEREFNGLKYYTSKVKNYENLIRIYHIDILEDIFYYTMEPADNFSAKCDEYEPYTLGAAIKRAGAMGYDPIVNIFDEILNGLEVLHDAGLVHRDLKPENIIFVNCKWKIGDIGLVSSVTKTLSRFGTEDFMPPEIRIGKIKELKQDSDIYALGKTLYCTYSGQPPDSFPHVPYKILKGEKISILNRLAKASCNTSPLVRIKTLSEFRNVLHGNIGLYFILRSFIFFLFRACVVSIALPYNIVGVAVKNSFMRNLVFLFLLATAIYFIRGCYVKSQWEKAAKSGILSVPDEQELDTLEKQEKLTDSQKKRLDELKTRVDRHASLLNVDSFTCAENASPARKHELVYKENFKTLDSWKIKNRTGLVVAEDGFVLGEDSDIDIILDKCNLPREYEIKLSLIPGKIMPELFFYVYSPASVFRYGQKPTSPEDNFPALFFWKINQMGMFRELIINDFEGDNMLRPQECQPLIPSIMHKPVNLSIVKTGNLIRIYHEDMLVYSPHPFSFTGGKFRIIVKQMPKEYGGSSEARLNKLEVYDIGIKNSGRNEFSEPRRKVTADSSSPKEESSMFPCEPELILSNAKNWKIYNPSAFRPSGEKFVFSDDIMFLFKHKLPENFTISLQKHGKENGILLMKFFKDIPRELDISEAFLSQPGIVINLTNMPEIWFQKTSLINCRIGTRMQRYITNDDIIVKKIGDVAIVGKELIMNAKQMSGYIAFYSFKATAFPVKKLRISNEFPYDLSLCQQEYLDWVKFTSPQLVKEQNMNRLVINYAKKFDVTNAKITQLFPSIIYQNAKLAPEIDKIFATLEPMSEKELQDIFHPAPRGQQNRRIISINNPSDFYEKALPKLMSQMLLPKTAADDLLKKLYPSLSPSDN